MMRDSKLLEELLNADTEDEVLAALESRGLLGEPTRWRDLGDFPNNQSVVNNQQSTAMAALVEKYTNALDAKLLRYCKAFGIDPRSLVAPKSMADAVAKYVGDVGGMSDEQRRAFAEDNLLLFATGSKARPCLWLYDNGEGQLAENFPTTFCSLIYGSPDGGSYKGAIPFVQGKFNMGGTGVLPFCSPKRMLQLIVSRVPSDVAGGGQHEWAYTLMCFFPSAKDPSWKYLVGPDGQVLTAGKDPLKLVPKKGAKSGEVCQPRERAVESGTLIKMYEFAAPRSNICGELFKKLGEYLIKPALPLRIMECRESYKAKVMGVTLWDRLGALVKNSELEEGTEDGVGVILELSTGETVPVEIRVFKLSKKKGEEVDEVRVGLRAMINGQSHAKRGSEFFKTKKVDKEHIAGSMLVTLDCTGLGQQSRNELFMANRETFRESALREELFKELTQQLRDHELLEYLNQKRFEEKVKNAVDDEEGIKAMEDLLADDPDLAQLFGGESAGPAGAKSATAEGDEKKVEKPKPFVGTDYPTYFKRKDGATDVEVEVPRGGVTRVSYITDVRNNYFTRSQNRGSCTFVGDFAPSHRLYNGRLTFTCRPAKTAVVGTVLGVEATITDPKGSGPFKLRITAKVVSPTNKTKATPKPKPPKEKAAPSRPRILEVDDRDVTDPAITVERNKGNLEIYINMKAESLTTAKAKRAPEEAAGVEFVFKYGLALLAMALIDKARATPEWQEEESACRERIGRTVSDMARVIVPLCLNLPKKLPKAG